MTDNDVEMVDVDDVVETTAPKEVIPPLRTLAHSILVPLTVDITQPEEEPNEVQRIQRILESIDYHHKGMKENLLRIFEREKRRIILEASEREVALGQQGRKPGIPRREEDMIIRNMEAPANWNKTYNLSSEKLASYKIRGIPEGAPISVRDATVVHLLTVVEKSLSELNSLDSFMNNKIKSIYIERLAKEMDKVAKEQQGNRQQKS
ncbi:hypothetical protein QBC38DRAFT_475103 [Podospora fimiseda]|uniref:Uncharacterized protein n=1 Tax=Podospora fimiseda TaxID=252190 RepID=A0AAN7BRV7_9PEZI|nr:hypothetical protein QBC38DRAFT_475103 [Podospora fimiseda]